MVAGHGGSTVSGAFRDHLALRVIHPAVHQHLAFSAAELQRDPAQFTVDTVFGKPPVAFGVDLFSHRIQRAVVPGTGERLRRQQLLACCYECGPVERGVCLDKTARLLRDGAIEPVVFVTHAACRIIVAQQPAATVKRRVLGGCARIRQVLNTGFEGVILRLLKHRHLPEHAVVFMALQPAASVPAFDRLTGTAQQ